MNIANRKFAKENCDGPADRTTVASDNGRWKRPEKVRVMNKYDALVEIVRMLHWKSPRSTIVAIILLGGSRGGFVACVTLLCVVAKQVLIDG